MCGNFEMASSCFLKLRSLDVVLHKSFTAHFSPCPNCLFSPILCVILSHLHNRSWRVLAPLSLGALEIVFANGYPYVCRLSHSQTHALSLRFLHLRAAQDLTLGSTESQSSWIIMSALSLIYCAIWENPDLCERIEWRRWKIFLRWIPHWAFHYSHYNKKSSYNPATIMGHNISEIV